MRQGFAALALVVLLAACARQGPPAPVFNYGLQTRENMTLLVRQQTPPPVLTKAQTKKTKHVALSSSPALRERKGPAESGKVRVSLRKPVLAAPHPHPPIAKGDGPHPVPQSGRGRISSFIWPVHGRVVSGYGSKPGGLYNDGVNIAAPRGTAVLAAAEGTVAYVGNKLGGYGNLVLIRHGGGMMTAYAHLGLVTVKQGARVKKGQSIGGVGATGGVPSPQLHFEIRKDGDAVDPEAYL